MLTLLLAWGGATVAWGERITANGGDGWDGRIYRSIAERFSDPIPELSTYSGRRCLPSGIVLVERLAGDIPVPGWSSLMVVTLLVMDVQLMMMGIFGEYLWRNLEQSRGRCHFIVERELARSGGVVASVEAGNAG